MNERLAPPNQPAPRLGGGRSPPLRGGGPPGIGRRSLIGLLAAAAAGCTAGNPYVLMPVPGYALTSSPKTVAVRGISLPQVPQAPDIAHASDVPMPPAQASVPWAEPLDLMIGRVLTQNLIQRLPGSYVFFDPHPPYSPADVWVDLTVARFDTNQAGDALIQASVGVIGLRFITRSAWKTVTPADDSTQALVTALSIALGRFCDLVAALVVESRYEPFR